MRPPRPASVLWPGAGTRPVALLGHPVAHSLSPRLHNTVFRALALDLVYLALPVAPADLPTVVSALGSAGAAGANVTVPHKLAVHALCDELSEEAQLVGAVNTLVWRDGVLHGTTTDTTGLGRVLADTVEGLSGSMAVVLGTGGAARAAVVALGRAGADVAVIGRRHDEAQVLGELGHTAGAPWSRGLDLADSGVLAAIREARVVVNATVLGMKGEPLPPAFMDLRPGQVAHDLVYGQGTTPFVAAARNRGAVAHDGTAMLVAQAADSFAVWTGQQAPEGAYEQALADAPPTT